MLCGSATRTLWSETQRPRGCARETRTVVLGGEGGSTGERGRESERESEGERERERDLVLCVVL